MADMALNCTHGDSPHFMEPYFMENVRFDVVGLYLYRDVYMRITINSYDGHEVELSLSWHEARWLAEHAADIVKMVDANPDV